MNKLRTYGIGGDVANWIRAFLNERTQQVVVDGCNSDSTAVMSGVPQGTVMGPLLFFLYINDLPSVVDPGTTVRLFADDCLIYRQIRSIEDHVQLQKDLDALSKWGDAWGIKFNESKCNILTITNLETTTTWFHTLNSVILQHVDSAKYLGIRIHKSLRFSKHINATAKKCSQRLGFLQRTLRQCPQELRELAYISLVRSCAEYGAVVWDPFLKKDKQALEKIQNRAARWVSGVKRYQPASVTKLRHQLKWPTLEQRRKHQRLSFMHKIMNGEVGITKEMLSLEDSDSRTQKKHRHKLKTKSGRTTELKNSFINRSIPDWNLLPAPVAEAASADIFKRQLAAHLP